MNKNLKLSLAACAVAVSAASAQAANSEVFVGGSAARDSEYGYIGGVTSLGHDISSDGALLRASTGYGGYTYSRTGSTDVDGTVSDTDLMVGYQKFVSIGKQGTAPSRLTLYAGGNYINQDINKTDTHNQARGDKWGLKGLGDARINVCPQGFINLAGSYSGAFNTYWSNARVGYNAGKFSVGPEASFLGNKAFDQQRFGVFVGDIALTQNVGLTVAGGYSNSERRGKDGGYGDVSVDFKF